MATMTAKREETVRGMTAQEWARTIVAGWKTSGRGYIDYADIEKDIAAALEAAAQDALEEFLKSDAEAEIGLGGVRMVWEDRSEKWLVESRATRLYFDGSFAAAIRALKAVKA